jgi:hypothetical protein
MNGAAACGEEARGGEAPRGGELEAARGGEAGSGRQRWPGAGGGGEDARARVAVVATESFGILTASARALARDLKFFSKS